MGSADTNLYLPFDSCQISNNPYRGKWSRSTVAEFIEARKSIEMLATHIALCVQRKVLQDLKQRLDEANQQLEVLKTMVAKNVQVIAATRLSRQLTGLGTKIEKMAGKRTIGKKLKTPVRSKTEEAPQIVVFEHP